MNRYDVFTPRGYEPLVARDGSTRSTQAAAFLQIAAKTGSHQNG